MMPRYIDADAAIDAARRSPVGRLMIKKHNLDGWLLGLPAADVAPVRHGEWIRTEYHEWRCSDCWCIVEEDEEPTWNCCPNCGAKMDKEGE